LADLSLNQPQRGFPPPLKLPNHWIRIFTGLPLVQNPGGDLRHYTKRE
jgi:hypothetical protein